MLNKVTNLLIGKNISRTAALVDGAALPVIEANIVAGEVVVLDKNFKIAPAAITYATSDVIYIAEGSVDTYNYTNEAGTSVVGARRLIVSDPINGKYVKSYNGTAYAAKTECTATVAAISGTITAGTEYVLKFIYKDITEHPGQFTQTYRYVAKSGDTSQSIFNGLRARIAKHTGARISASGTTTLIATAKPIPSATSKVDSINDMWMVEFDVRFTYLDSEGNHQLVPAVVTTTAKSQGKGTWESIRDLEKKCMSYRGVTNFTQFPVIKPDFRTEKGATYTTITIAHETPYMTPNNQYTATAGKELVIAINGATANQGDNIETRLNAWMASIPGAFANSAVFAAV